MCCFSGFCFIITSNKKVVILLRFVSLSAGLLKNLWMNFLEVFKRVRLETSNSQLDFEYDLNLNPRTFFICYHCEIEHLILTYNHKMAPLTYTK